MKTEKQLLRETKRALKAYHRDYPVTVDDLAKARHWERIFYSTTVYPGGTVAIYAHRCYEVEVLFDDSGRIDEATLTAYASNVDVAYEYANGNGDYGDGSVVTRLRKANDLPASLLLLDVLNLINDYAK